MRSTMTINKKLMSGFAALVVLSGVLAITSFSSIRELIRGFDQAVDQTVRKVVLASAVGTAQSDMFHAQQGMLLASFAKNSAATESNRQLFLENVNKLRKAVEEIRPLLILGEGKRQVNQIEEVANSWLEIFPQV